MSWHNAEPLIQFGRKQPSEAAPALTNAAEWSYDMDDELKQHLEAMESRLMGRINGVMERLLEVQGNLRDLRSEHSVTRDMVLKLPGTVLGAIEAPLLKRIRTTEDRLDKLEGGA
jgi:hypothetical protein